MILLVNKQKLLAVALLATLSFSIPNRGNAGISIMPSAEYNPSTGEIYVNIDSVVNWYIESASGGLTGDDPLGLPAAGGLLTNNDFRIGETSFAPFGYDLSLGTVAAPNLPPGDLTINWNTALGQQLQTYNFGPPPHFDFAKLEGPIVVDLATDPLSITLDASNSSGFGFPFDFVGWDIDGVPGFEIDTTPDTTLEIADVTATFGGVGVYEVKVGLGYIHEYDEATTTVTIINSIPEPDTTSLGLLMASLLVAVRSRTKCGS